ncbi:MAG: hypothetical protein GWP10_19340 [Nitrospiraceae bacterium]|nr:hypothetical protein [Nitrospiraceae bacterium]
MEEKESKNQEQFETAIPREFQAMIAGISSTKYFDSRFDYLQVQIDELRRNQKDIKLSIRDFKQDVDKSQEDIRFQIRDLKYDVDKRFEQVDKRFEQIITSIDRLSEKLDHRDESQRNFTIRMFSISIAISILGALGAFLKVMGIF